MSREKIQRMSAPRAHLQQQVINDNLRCNRCYKEFKYRPLLEDHMNTVHYRGADGQVEDLMSKVTKKKTLLSIFSNGFFF